MDNLIQELSISTLFNNFSQHELEMFVHKSNGYTKSFLPGMNIFEPEQTIHCCGIILEGVVDVLHSSYYGNEAIVNRYSTGDLVGESFSFTKCENHIAFIRSGSACTLYFFNIRQIIEHDNTCIYYQKLILNIINQLATTNILLNKKIQLLTQKTLREKLLMYFSQLCKNNKSKTATLPFNREQLAQYINSERSSVCRELTKMQQEDLIVIERNKIELHVE